MIHRVALVSLFLAGGALGQTVNDANLEVRHWVGGLDSPTGIAFTGDGDEAFVIQKEDGRVRLMRNRSIVDTVLNLPVANASEQGLLGIALHPNYQRNKLVYLYHTNADSDGGDAINNRIDRYRFDGANLVFDKTIKKIPAGPGPNHDGGKITFGPDGKLYAVVGDLNRDEQTQNYASSNRLTRSGVILRLNASGSSPTDNPFYDQANTTNGNRALNDIYAYGVRNSFGLEFDPRSDVLWDTENGPNQYDEINRIRPGFNSGWEDIMGPTERVGSSASLVSLGPEARYVEPRFSWVDTVAPTDLHFNTSTRLGDEYRNDLFVGDVNTGALYHFDLADNRKGLKLTGDLRDRVADNLGDIHDEQEQILFGEGFGVVTDLVTGPGGMFVLTLDGDLYRIRERPPGVAMSEFEALPLEAAAVPEPAALGWIILAGALFVRRSRAAEHRRFNCCTTIR